MKKVKTILAITAVISIISIGIIAYRTSIKDNNMKKSAATVVECSIELKNDNIVLVKFNNQAGIKEIKYPSGDVISCNGKKTVGVDLKVSKNGKYEYTLKDINNVEKKYTVYAPGVHVELTKNDINIDLESAKNVIKNNLVNSLVVTNFITIHAVEGDRETISSETTDMETLFNTWNRFGNGNWSYKDGEIKNTKNVDVVSGYYSPESNYTDLNFSFIGVSTGTDDDMIGCVARYNNANNGQGYVFWASGGGTGGHNLKTTYNGILKANGLRNIWADSTGSNIYSQVNLLAHTDWKWSKKVWYRYTMKIKGNKIEGYIDGSLKAQAQDDSFTKGSYGFVTLSQSARYYSFNIETVKALTLQEIIARTTWKTDEVNIIANFNNRKEEELSTQACVNAFNNNGIHYTQITSSANANEINTFLSKIGNRGKYIESSNYNTYMSQLSEYIATYVRNHT